MLKKCKSILYTLDLIGKGPQLFIFKDKTYKSLFSSFLSLIIILFSIIYIILSLFEYLKYESPIISYSKGNDENTKRAIFIKDTFLIFQLIDTTTIETINNSIAYYEAEYKIIYDNGNIEGGQLEIEKCKLGKNIDLKYKNFIENKSDFGKSLEEFYCISSKNPNISIFYNPNIGSSTINLNIILRNNSNFIPEKMQSLIVCENDLIDHSNRDDPFSKSFSYYLTTSYSSLEYTTINYYYQFIKYDSDDGLFYKNSKTSYGATYSDIFFYKNYRDDYDLNKNFEKSNITNIGKIEFAINKSSFDYYNRTYKRLPALLAEITSVISLIFQIGSYISFIFCDKNMNKDIINDLLNENKFRKINVQNHNKILLKDNIKKNIEIRRSKTEIDDKMTSIDYLDKTDKNRLNNIKKSFFSSNEKVNEALTKINHYHILKSYFCFKDKKTKLIDFCENFISEETSIEKILERFYNLDSLFQFFLNKEEDLENFRNKKFEDIRKNIIEINDDIQKEIYLKKEIKNGYIKTSNNNINNEPT